MHLFKFLLMVLFVVISNDLLEAQSRSKAYWIENGHITNNYKVVFKNRQSVFYKTEDGKAHAKFIHADSGQLTSYAMYKTARFKILHGTYQDWYDNGKLWIKGNYLDNKKQGQWETYSFPNGNLEQAVVYKNDLRNGQFEKYDSLGNVVFQAEYREDRIHGTALRFNPRGDTLQVCHFIEGVEQDCSGDYHLPEEKPYISTALCALTDTSKIEACRQRALYEAIFSRLSYPAKDRNYGVQGKAFIAFDVEKDGTLSNFQTLRGISNGIERASLKAIKTLPKWIPGKHNGKPVRVKYSLPISFKLE